MERLILPGEITADQEKFYQGLMDSALGNPQVMTTSPTTANGLLKENNLGFDGTNLFLTIEGTTYRISLTAV